MVIRRQSLVIALLMPILGGIFGGGCASPFVSQSVRKPAPAKTNRTNPSEAAGQKTSSPKSTTPNKVSKKPQAPTSDGAGLVHFSHGPGWVFSSWVNGPREVYRNFKSAWEQSVSDCPPGRLPVWRFNSTTDFETFKSLCLERDKTFGQQRVIRDLLNEKVFEVQNANQNIREQFGVEPGGAYLEEEEGVVLNVETPPGSGMRRLSPEQSASFLRLQRIRNLSSQAIRMLQLLQLEKKQEIALLQNRLSRYGVRPNLNYELDVQRSFLYQIIR